MRRQKKPSAKSARRPRPSDLFLPSRAAVYRPSGGQSHSRAALPAGLYRLLQANFFFMNFLSQEICGGPFAVGRRIFLFPTGKRKNSFYNFVKSIQKSCICAILYFLVNAKYALKIWYTENQLNILRFAPSERCGRRGKGPGVPVKEG